MGEPQKEDEIGILEYLGIDRTLKGIAPYDEELTLSASDIKKPKAKSRPHKNQVLLQSRLSTRHQKTAQTRVDYKSFVEADDLGSRKFFDELSLFNVSQPYSSLVDPR